MHDQRKPRSIWFSDQEWEAAQDLAKEKDQSVSALFRLYIKSRRKK